MNISSFIIISDTINRSTIEDQLKFISERLRVTDNKHFRFDFVSPQALIIFWESSGRSQKITKAWELTAKRKVLIWHQELYHNLLQNWSWQWGVPYSVSSHAVLSCLNLFLSILIFLVILWCARAVHLHSLNKWLIINHCPIFVPVFLFLELARNYRN